MRYGLQAQDKSQIRVTGLWTGFAGNSVCFHLKMRSRYWNKKTYACLSGLSITSSEHGQQDRCSLLEQQSLYRGTECANYLFGHEQYAT